MKSGRITTFPSFLLPARVYGCVCGRGVAAGRRGGDGTFARPASGGAGESRRRCLRPQAAPHSATLHAAKWRRCQPAQVRRTRSNGEGIRLAFFHPLHSFPHSLKALVPLSIASCFVVSRSPSLVLPTLPSLSVYIPLPTSSLKVRCSLNLFPTTIPCSLSLLSRVCPLLIHATALS